MAADAPSKKALTIWKGFSFTERVIVSDKATGLVRDITGYAPKLVIEVNGSVVATLTVGTGLVLSPTIGQIDIRIPDTDTAAYVWTDGTYALSIDNSTPTGNELLMYGAVTVRDSAG